MRVFHDAVLVGCRDLDGTAAKNPTMRYCSTQVDGYTLGDVREPNLLIVETFKAVVWEMSPGAPHVVTVMTQNEEGRLEHEHFRALVGAETAAATVLCCGGGGSVQMWGMQSGNPVNLRNATYHDPGSIDAFFKATRETMLAHDMIATSTVS